MRKLFILLISFYLVFSPTIETKAAPGDMKWKYSAVGSGVFEEFIPTLLVIDEQGNRIFASSPGDISTSTNWLTVSVDMEGNLNWQRSYADHAVNIVSEVAVDHENNVIVAGITADTTTGFWHVISYDPEGNVNWSRDIDAGISSISGLTIIFSLTSMAIDSGNNIILGGRFTEKSGDTRGYIYSISPGGDKNWDALSTGFGKFSDMVMDIAVDSSDNIAVAYGVNSTTPSMYTGLYASDGQKIWQQEIPEQRPAYPFHIVVDHADNILVSGNSIDGNETIWYTASLSSSGGINWHSEQINKGSGLPFAIVADNENNAIVTGIIEDGTSKSMLTLSYDPDGNLNWEREETGPGGEAAGGLSVDIDMADNIIAGGFSCDPKNECDEYMVSYSKEGMKDWEKAVDAGSKEMVVNLDVDRKSGDIVTLALKYDSPPTTLLRDFEGPKPPEPPPVILKSPGERRTFDPASEDVDLEHGIYLGLGSVCAGGSIFRMEAEFPAYVEEDGMTPLAVKIFIAFQIPGYPDTFYFIDGTGQVHPFPQDPTAPWRNKITGPLHEVVFNDMDIKDPGISVPSGIYTFYTLIVPDSAPDDISMLDLNTTPYELTSNIFEIK